MAEDDVKEEVQETVKEEKVDPPKEGVDKKKEEEGPKDDIRTAIKEVLQEMGIGRTPVAPTRRADMETMAEQMVRDASAKLDKEKELEGTIADLKKKVEEVTEETPRKVRRLTKAMWGDEK